MVFEKGSLRDAWKNISDTESHLCQSESSCFRHLNAEGLAVLESSTMRQLDSFLDFLRPNRWSTLQHAAADGPVMLLNASKAGCSALILTSCHVPEHEFDGGP